MPSVSQNQQTAAAIAKKDKDEGTKSKPGTASAEMAKSMSTKELDKFASTKRKGLPKKVNKESFDARLEAALFENITGIYKCTICNFKTRTVGDVLEHESDTGHKVKLIDAPE
jgi:hypothetical protein